MKTTILLVVLLFSFYGQAKPCAEVNSESAEVCTDLKVFFDLKKCNSDQKKVEAQIECKQKTATATYANGSYSWSVNFKLSEGKWGTSVWKQSGTLKEKKISHAVHSPYVKPQLVVQSVEREIAQEKKSIDFKMNGYFDFRFNSIENNDNPNVTHSGQPESGFSIEEAALYVSGQATDFSFFLDLPLRRDKTTAGVSESSQLVLGADRAQAYLKVLLMDSLFLTLGQFDTPYGVELNDSKDRVFMKTGLLYDYALPVTHTGVSIDGSVSSLSYRVLAANSNNKGSFGNTTSGDNQTEFGATLGFSNEYLRSQLGYISRAIEESSGEKGGTRSMFDATFGFNWKSAAFDFEWASVQNDNKTTKKNGTAFMFLPTYKFNDQFLLGLRFEMLKGGVDASATFEDADSAGLSAHWKLNDNLQFRSEIIKFNYNTQSGGTEGDQTRVTFTSLFSF